MAKIGTIQLSSGFVVIIILSVAIFSMGIFFVQKIHSATDGKMAEADEQAKIELARLRNEGEKVALAPTTIQESGTVLLMIANDASVDSSKFGFKIFYGECFNGPCGATSPIDWIGYSTRGTEDDPFQIKPYESREFLIAVNPTGNSPGTYVFDVEVRWNSIDDDEIVYEGMPADIDALYSRLKFYVKI